MTYNMYDRIDLAVNEIFDFKGTALQVVKDHHGSNCCVGCAFYHKPECNKFECLSEDRADGTPVHFINFKEVVYESK